MSRIQKNGNKFLVSREVHLKKAYHIDTPGASESRSSIAQLRPLLSPSLNPFETAFHNPDYPGREEDLGGKFKEAFFVLPHRRSGSLDHSRNCFPFFLVDFLSSTVSPLSLLPFWAQILSVIDRFHLGFPHHFSGLKGFWIWIEILDNIDWFQKGLDGLVVGS